MRQVSADVANVDEDDVIEARSEMDSKLEKGGQNLEFRRNVGEAYVHGLMDGELLSYIGRNPVRRATRSRGLGSELERGPHHIVLRREIFSARN